MAQLLLVALILALCGMARGAELPETLFPTELPGRDWVHFRAEGFSEPACGVIHRLGNTVTNGMALGGLDTGCIDLETNGLLGYCTIFNTHVPRRGPIGLPFLGLSVGERTWVLCGPEETTELQSLTEWQLEPDLGAGQRLWAPGPSQLPAWLRSVGELPYDIPAGRVACHSPAVLRWISPVTSTVSIRGGLWLTRDLERPQNWELTLAGVALASGQLPREATSEAPMGLAGAEGEELVAEVEAGDVLELVLTPAGGMGDYVGMDLAISGAGQEWDLAGDWSDEQNPNGPWTYDAASRPMSAAGLAAAEDIELPSEIHYWGHYPVADVEFDLDGPVSVGLRSWAPFLPGDTLSSMIPGIVFEAHLRNTSDEPQEGTLAFCFPGPEPREALADEFPRREALGEWRGVVVETEMASYALGAVGREKVRLGGALGGRPSAWARIADELPEAPLAHSGASVAVDFSLEPGEHKTVRFLLAWCAPQWNGMGHNWATEVTPGYSGEPRRFRHMYAKHYPSAEAAADVLAARHEELLERVLAWQEVIYTEDRLPVWLRDGLINVLYMIAEDGYWAQKEPPIPDWVREEDGLFGMNECPRGCPQIECIPCSFYGSLPLAYFFPEVELSTLRGYAGYQFEDGAPTWIFGGCTGQTPPIDFAYPTRGYQFATNGISLASLVDQFLMCHDTPDRELLRELYPMVKKSATWTVGLRTTPEYTIGERIISMPDGNVGTEWFEAPEPGWSGMTAHVGGLHIAELLIAQRMANAAGDEAFADQCEEWISSARDAMEERLWAGSYYLNFLEPETDTRSDLVFGYQLDGEWIAAHHGLPSTLPQERIVTVLDTIKRFNVGLTRSGAVNYASPDGTPAECGGYGTYSYFPPEALMLAMTYMYHGERDFGLELARRVWHNLYCLQGYTWDMPNIMRGDRDTGERTFGNDYYQDMMLWSLPAALAGEDLSSVTKPGGLVDRVVRAARGQG